MRLMQAPLLSVLYLFVQNVRPYSRAAATFPAGANQIRLARRTKIRLVAVGDFSGGGGGILCNLVMEAHHIISEPKYGTCGIYS